MSSPDVTADSLRAEMIAAVVPDGSARWSPIAEALRRTPRHLFLPGVPLADAYASGQAVVTRRGPSGAPLSSASAPSMVALMLDQLDVRPGDRVLEIGAGTGWNAALLAALAGPSGQVTTVEVDPDTAADAARNLAARNLAGGPTVAVRTGDGALGVPDRAPFDRVIVTAGAWDVPPAWTDQLVPGGRLVVPLRWRGQSYSVAFVAESDHLRSESLEFCGFIPMTGPDGERRHRLGPDAELVVDADQDVDPARLSGVLDGPGHLVGSGVVVGPQEPLNGIGLRLGATEPGTCRLTERVPDRAPRSVPALVDGDSLARLDYRRFTDAGTSRTELGARGVGPRGADLADRIVGQVRAWAADRRDPRLTAHPAGTPDTALPDGGVIDKAHVRLVLTTGTVSAPRC